MPDEHSPVRHILALRRIDPEQNLSRFYTLVIERDLFGQVVLVRSWGRIGARGREIVEPYLDELEAGSALGRIAARKRRRGYRDL